MASRNNHQGITISVAWIGPLISVFAIISTAGVAYHRLGTLEETVKEQKIIVSGLKETYSQQSQQNSVAISEIRSEIKRLNENLIAQTEQLTRIAGELTSRPRPR